MLIKFLYNEFKNKLLFYFLPQYLIQLLFYELSMHTLEFYIHALYASKDEDEQQLVLDEKSARLRIALAVIVYFNFVLVVCQTVFVAVTF